MSPTPSPPPHQRHTLFKFQFHEFQDGEVMFWNSFWRKETLFLLVKYLSYTTKRPQRRVDGLKGSKWTEQKKKRLPWGNCILLWQTKKSSILVLCSCQFHLHCLDFALWWLVSESSSMHALVVTMLHNTEWLSSCLSVWGKAYWTGTYMVHRFGVVYGC